MRNHPTSSNEGLDKPPRPRHCGRKRPQIRRRDRHEDITLAQDRAGAPGLPGAGGWADSQSTMRLNPGYCAPRHSSLHGPSKLDLLGAGISLMRIGMVVPAPLGLERCAPNGNRPGAVDREAVPAERRARSPRAWQRVLGSDSAQALPGHCGSDRSSSLLELLHVPSRRVLAPGPAADSA